MDFLLKITEEEISFVNSTENRCEESRLEVERPEVGCSVGARRTMGKDKHAARVSDVSSR